MKAVAVCAALVPLCVMTAQASAQSIAVAPACVINTPSGVGTVTVTGSGFTPGDYITLQAADDGDFGTGIASSVGAFQTSFDGPVLPTAGPDVSTYELLATDVTTSAMATTSFSVANLAASITPTKSKPGAKVRYSASGFDDGAEIYGHFLNGDTLVDTVKLGRAQGPCGQLKTTAKLPVVFKRNRAYTVQFDDARDYSAGSVPRSVTHFRVRTGV